MKNICGPHADYFLPEHCETGEISNLGKPQLPFNGGPRHRLTEELAVTEASFTFLRLLQKFSSINLPFGENYEHFAADTDPALSASGHKVEFGD